MKTYTDYDLLNNNTFGISARCARFVEIETAEEAVSALPLLAQGDEPLMVIGAGSNLLLTKDFPGTVIRSAIKGITLKHPEPSEHQELSEHPETSEHLESSEHPEPSEHPNPQNTNLKLPVPGDSIAGITSLSAGTALLTAGSGETFDDVISAALARGLYGMENLSIIPGDVGASAVQNIGAYGVEAADIIHSIDAVEIKTGKRITIPASECHYAYRQSRFKQEWRGRYFILSVTYRLQTTFTPRLSYGGIQKALQAAGKLPAPSGSERPVSSGSERPVPCGTERPVPGHIMAGGSSPLTANDVRQTIIDIRNAKLPDPKKLGNGGSFFMNPIVSEEKFRQLQQLHPDIPYYIIDVETTAAQTTAAQTSPAPRKYKIPAGWLIEQCGWKGKSLGRAAVHDRQALVLVNRGGATGQEILDLCNTLRQAVQQHFGIEIHPEVNIV